MKKCRDLIGGVWVALSLYVQCSFKTSKGSYIAWRKETAFGKTGQFPQVSNAMKRKAMWSWAVWAWIQRSTKFR